MQLNEACVVGFGMIDALGDNPVTCWENLINDQDFHKPIDHLIDPSDLQRVGAKVGFYPEIELNPRTHRTLQYGMHAADEAIRMSNLPQSQNVAVVFSSLTGGESSKALARAAGKMLKPKMAIKCTQDSLATDITLKYGYTGINTSVYSACATGLVSIDYAMRILDEYDYVIVGGADAGINSFQLPTLTTIRALGTRSRPFDNNRDGFVMGEGAGCIILQSKAKAEEMNSKVYARITGVANASDAFDLTSPSGTGARKCLEKLDLHGVDSVNSHGTGTPIGDPIEYNVVREFTNAPIYSNKGKIGHTLAAAGVLETIYSILSIQNGCIPHSAGCTESDMDINMENVYTDVRKVLVNSFGFGGKCCSIIVEKP
jgi:3-oxoacyl-[acyl-carrier-protein] synthase II